MSPSFDLLVQGVLLGCGLAIMVGPIFVALIQTSIEKGGRAGLMVGLGIWISDLIFITVTYFFIHRVDHLVSDGTFKYWMGLLGGFVLIVFGISAMVKEVEVSLDRPAFSAKNLLSYWTKGFLVNTVNPFTFIFWISVILTYVIKEDIEGSLAWTFLGAILTVIILTDAVKVLLAKKIRKKMNPTLISKLIKISGLVLLLFGIALIVRTN